jgi:hypothetical protein
MLLMIVLPHRAAPSTAPCLLPASDPKAVPETQAGPALLLQQADYSPRCTRHFRAMEIIIRVKKIGS